jgi:hypothetical protein
MINRRIVNIIGIVVLIIALVFLTSMLPPQSQSQAMLPEVGEQSQVIEEQISPPGNATATITITMTGVADDSSP